MLCACSYGCTPLHAAAQLDAQATHLSQTPLLLLSNKTQEAQQHGRASVPALAAAVAALQQSLRLSNAPLPARVSVWAEGQQQQCCCTASHLVLLLPAY